MSGVHGDLPGLAGGHRRDGGVYQKQQRHYRVFTTWSVTGSVDTVTSCAIWPPANQPASRPASQPERIADMTRIRIQTAGYILRSVNERRDHMDLGRGSDSVSERAAYTTVFCHLLTH